MKNILFLAILIAGAFVTQNLSAQDVSEFQLIANYTLIDTDVDETGINDVISLVNVPFQGTDGVYSNGNYIGGDSDSCQIQTPTMPMLDYTQFMYSVEFKVTDLSLGKPVIMGGFAYRWSGAFLNSSDSTLHLVYNGNITSSSNQAKVSAGDWHTVAVQYMNGKGSLFLDGQKVDSVDYVVESVDFDKKLMNANGGMGKTFKGNWKNLKVYGPKSTSVQEDLKENIHCTVYPNPSSSVFQISGLTPNESHQIEVYNMQGQRIFMTKCNVDHLLLDLGSNDAGVYLLMINEQYSQRLLKK